MPAYHQMGHDSENLLHAGELNAYRGAILSPVNYVQDKVASQIIRARSEQNFETIFDPQLYFPNTERGHLREWSYFPSDVDTADLTSELWWDELTERVVSTCSTIRPTAACSPAVVPRAFTNDYFSNLVRIGARLAASLSGSEIRPIQTAIVGLSDLTTPNRSLAIASLLSRTVADEIYLVLVGDTDPRREINSTEELKGALKLIAALQESGLRVLVGYCSSDLALWKAAGATSCATGKFFNLRRFSRARFEEPPQGGGQLPYWFEEALMAFLRESDLIRANRLGVLSQHSLSNPFGAQILNQLETSPGNAWVGLGWRQYMYWFADFEQRLAQGDTVAGTLLADAETNWRMIEDVFPPLLMEEPRNDGGWLRPWRRALVEFRSF